MIDDVTESVIFQMFDSGLSIEKIGSYVLHKGSFKRIIEAREYVRALIYQRQINLQSGVKKYLI